MDKKARMKKTLKLLGEVVLFYVVIEIGLTFASRTFDIWTAVGTLFAISVVTCLAGYYILYREK